MTTSLPVAIIGAGPVGLAAALHLRERGLQPLVFEAGRQVGAGMRQWAHVRMFSPWAYNIDRLAGELLESHGWQGPDPTHFPTGGELVSQYLEPLAALPELAPHIRLGARVTAVARHGRDRMKNADRDQRPYLVRFEVDGVEDELLAAAVIDASGTLSTPNPLGASGIAARGERAAAGNIFYGMPDVLGSARPRYAGKRVLVVGSGHSAFNVLADLARLRGDQAARIEWAVRRTSLRRVLGGGENDQLKERGLLGTRIGAMVDAGTIRLHADVHIDRIERRDDGLVAWSGGRELPAVDEIVATTGFRPDYDLLAELRLELDPGTQSPRALAPLIDPNLHSCGTVRPHGARELAHPDPDLYVVGMKSYGRAPTFLLLTGYEQVRSVAAAIAGDHEAAGRVELVLPETGVCQTQFADEDGDATGACCGTPAGAGSATVDRVAASVASARGSCGAGTGVAADGSTGTGRGCGSPAAAVPARANASAGCCGGPPAAGVDACCVRDAEAKAAGLGGCGCAEQPAATEPQALARCC